ncbi:MAG TPA: glycosyl transferase, partial [Telluria sp.]
MQKVHTTAVPRIGGVGVVAGLVLGFLLFRSQFSGQMRFLNTAEVFLLLGASLPAFLAGLIED